MGRVFLGQSPGGRLVAVKLIRAELAENPAFRARFAREVAAARLVSGIYTAPVVDADPDGPQPWLVTAYVEGQSLADAVLRHGPLPLGSVLTLAAGLAEGLDAIHAAGVVHRDLKPSNVILAADGPRIIDFGISRAQNAASLTNIGWVAGSPGFMSPEQAEGHQAGPPTDIFALGALLTFASNGEGPFGTGLPTAMLYRVVHCAPALGRMPAKLKNLVEHCLDKDPARRPTAAQILAEPGLLVAAPDCLPVPPNADAPLAVRTTRASHWTPALGSGWSRSGPASLDQPTSLDQPPDLDQPASPDQPAERDQPLGLDQPASPDQPAERDHPPDRGTPTGLDRPPDVARHRCHERRAGRHELLQENGRTRRVLVIIAAVIAVAAATTAAVESHRTPDRTPAGASSQVATTGGTATYELTCRFKHQVMTGGDRLPPGTRSPAT
jgi:serine/threonine protein kinase